MLKGLIDITARKSIQETTPTSVLQALWEAVRLDASWLSAHSLDELVISHTVEPNSCLHAPQKGEQRQLLHILDWISDFRPNKRGPFGPGAGAHKDYTLCVLVFVARFRPNFSDFWRMLSGVLILHRRQSPQGMALG